MTADFVKNSPTLALCIPAYNAAAFLPRLLNSARQQHIAFDEVYVYDDCSNDQTKKVAEEFGATVISGTVNKGCSFGKNKLTESVKSDWIHFHDADDELLPNFTTLAHRWMAKPNCPDVVLFDYEYRDNETNELLGCSDFNSAELTEDPIRYAILNQINPFCGLYKKQELLKAGGYDVHPDILYNEDVAFHCKLAILGFSFGVEKEKSIINYRIQQSMSNANLLKCGQAHYHVMKINAEKVGQKYPLEISKKLLRNAAGLATYSDWDSVRKSIELVCSLPGGRTAAEGKLFRILFYLTPYHSFKIREKLIRLFKPHLRK